MVASITHAAVTHVLQMSVVETAAGQLAADAVMEEGGAGETVEARAAEEEDCARAVVAKRRVRGRRRVILVVAVKSLGGDRCGNGYD